MSNKLATFKKCFKYLSLKNFYVIKDVKTERGRWKQKGMGCMKGKRKADRQTDTEAPERKLRQGEKLFQEKTVGFTSE